MVAEIVHQISEREAERARRLPMGAGAEEGGCSSEDCASYVDLSEDRRVSQN